MTAATRRSGRAEAWTRWVRFDGLGPRLAALLTVALLPLGIVSLDQTRDLTAEAERRAGLSLLSLTREAVSPLQQAVERALGAAESLARLAPSFETRSGSGCGELLAGFVGERSPYAFVGILPAEGPVTCSTLDGPVDMTSSERMADYVDDPRPRVSPRTAGTLSGAAVLVVTVPYGPMDDPLGVVALSIRRDSIAPPGEVGPGERPIRLAVVNSDGELIEDLGFGTRPPPLDSLLPATFLAGIDPEADPRIEREVDPGDKPRVYTVMPIVDGTLSALGVWTSDQGEGATGPVPAVPILFPLAMWLVSLVVAFWAANRLVVRPVAGLGDEMRRFGEDRSLAASSVPPDAPKELRDIDAAFREAAGSILRDEALMEEAFRERGMLLREIHHRVKNNLQLISSIISMQIRRAPDTRTRIILRRLQDRVLTLAAIYRSLYTSADVSEASVAPILRAIIEQEAAGHPGGVSLALDLEEIVLDTDKSVPLAFLVAEAVSNALLQTSGDRHVGVSLRRSGSEATLEVVNSIGIGGLADGARGTGLGLGAQLIAAFTTQLGGSATMGPRDGHYRLAVTFPLDEDGDGDGEATDVGSAAQARRIA